MKDYLFEDKSLMIKAFVKNNLTISEAAYLIVAIVEECSNDDLSIDNELEVKMVRSIKSRFRKFSDKHMRDSLNDWAEEIGYQEDKDEELLKM